MLLQEYPWPGNIRELKNVVAEAVVMAESGSLRPEHLPTRITAGTKAGEKPIFVPKDAELDGPVALRNPTVQPHEFDTGETETGPTGNGVYIPLGASLEEVQKTYVVRTLNYCANNKTYAARVLGVSRKTLYDKLLRWGITKQRI
jgi:DNA-binding NtrC family response regulator